VVAEVGAASAVVDDAELPSTDALITLFAQILHSFHEIWPHSYMYAAPSHIFLSEVVASAKNSVTCIAHERYVTLRS